MTLSLVAAPTGGRIGISAAGNSSRQLVVAVAPKAWRSGPAHHRRVTAWPTSQHHVLTLFELDRLHIDAPDADMQDLLARMLTVSRHTLGDGQLQWDSSLLAPDFPSRRELQSSVEHGTPPKQVAVTDLLELLDRVNLLLPDADSLRGAPSHSPLHRPLLYRKFIDEVGSRVHNARRGYRPRSQRMTVLRGKVDPNSLLRHQETGDPRLLCHFDELTESTVLLGVICSALEWIADGRGVHSPFDDRFSSSSLQRDAVALRRLLGEVSALPPHQALIVGTRLRLNRLDQPWASSLTLGLTVLAELEQRPGATANLTVDAVELSVETNLLWERIVHLALAHSGFDPVLAPTAQPPGLTEDPWSSVPKSPVRTRPDNVAWHGDQVVIVDAKYKQALASPPERGDQYQMFAYSHLVRDDPRRVTAAVLVYPGVPGKRVWLRGRDTSANPVKLFAAQVPFPAPGQIRHHRDWLNYLDVSGHQLADQIDLVKRTTLISA